MTIVKITLVFAVFLQASFCYAGPYDCGKWEYAKFKDASKKKLFENYCDWKSALSFNEFSIENRMANKFARNQEEIAEIQAGSASCESQTSEAAEMLLAKYKTRPPTTKECVCLGSGTKADVDECRKSKTKAK